MRLFVFSVRDEAVGAFLPPFVMRARGEAIRSFMDAAGDGDRFARHPSDFVLYALGEYDDVSGMFIQSEPVRVMSALECQVSNAGPSVANGGEGVGERRVFPSRVAL